MKKDDESIQKSQLALLTDNPRYIMEPFISFMWVSGASLMYKSWTVDNIQARNSLYARQRFKH